MILLAGLAGLRVHEVAKLRADHVDVDGRTIAVTGKGRTRAVLPAHDAITSHAAVMPGDGFWFPSADGKHLGGRVIGERIRLHMIRNRVPGTAHALRHTYATRLVEAGADLRVVQQLMRHGSLQTTAQYVYVSDSRRRMAVDALTVRLGGTGVA